MTQENSLIEFNLAFRQISWLIIRVIRSISGWRSLTNKRKKEINHQGIIEDDYIYRELYRQANAILIRNEEPDEAHYSIYGVTVKKKILHRKSEKKNGADLYLEIEGEKFALIQFKRQNKKGRFVFNKKQFKELSIFCKYCLNPNLMPPQCPVYVWLIDDSGYYVKHRIFRLCELQRILNGRMSAHKSEFFKQFGIYRRTYRELFVQCWVGARFKKEEINDLMTRYVEYTNRMVVNYSLSSEK